MSALSCYLDILWTCLLFFHSVSSVTLRSSDIPIGVFTQDEEIAVIINSTINNINYRRNDDFSLVPYTVLTNVSDAVTYKDDLCSVLKQGVFVVIGAENATTERSIISVTDTLHMPFVTFSDEELYTEGLKYKIRLTPSYSEILAALEDYYQWEHVFYLYNDQAGLARFQRFKGLFHGTEVEIDLRHLDPSLPNYYDTLRNLDNKYEGEKEFNEKVLIIDLSTEEQTQNLLDQLVDVGMTRDNYHVIPAILSMRNLNLERLKHGGVTVTGFQLNGLRESADSVQELAKDATELVVRALDELTYRDKTVFKDVYRRGDMYNGDWPGVPCHQYDNPWKKGPIIMDTLKRTAFNGLTGLVEFDEDGYRINHSFEVLQQTRETKLQKVATWSQHEGLVTSEGIRHRKKKRRQETGFYNETFTIVTVLTEPYAMLKTSPDGQPLEGNDQYEGYAIDLANKLAEIIGFNYVIKVPPDMKHGNQLPNGSWNGLIGELINRRADMAIADLTITSVRERVVDFSTPFMNLGISIMIRKPEKQKPSVFSFMEPLSNQVWIFIALSFTVVTIVIFIISRLSPAEWKIEETADGESDISNDFTLQNSAWFVSGALMCQGSDLSPVSPASRIVSSGWWFFTLIVISSYTANLAAFLTVENIVTPIKDVVGLAEQDEIKFGTLDSGTSRVFFENSSNPFFLGMWNKMNSQNPSVLVTTSSKGIERVRNSKGKYAFLLESTTNEYANQRKPCNTIKIGENLDSKNYGVATPINHKLRHQVTMAILRLHETGELNKLKQTWWYDKGQCNNEDSGSSIKALSLSNVAGVFYILIGGLIIAMFCALFEFILKSVKDAKKYKKSLRASMKSKARLSIAGESDDSPYFFLPRPSAAAFRMSIDPPPS